MGFLFGPALLLLLALRLVSAEDYLEVIYQKKTITLAIGSSAKLSCEAFYDFDKCGVLHVVWHKVEEESTELTDSSRYFTTVNETVTPVGMRRRQVLTEIISVKPNDDGQYQCKAHCESGAQAIGHSITINVIGKSFG